MGNVRATPRGFKVYAELTDTYGSNVQVQESSSAEGPRVWIFADSGLQSGGNASPHLDVAQAKRVRDALGMFIRDHGGDDE